jgi:hypothetical protein
LVDIFYLPNFGGFDKTGVFQQPRLVTTIDPLAHSISDVIIKLAQEVHDLRASLQQHTTKLWVQNLSWGWTKKRDANITPQELFQDDYQI